MSPERWQRLDGLFDEALDLPAAARGAFLDERCAGEPDLREELEALLEACESSGDFLDEPPHSLAGEVVGPLFGTAEVGLAPGQAVGPYRIVGPIGRGGMGVVYLADRADGHFRKRVAIKVVKRGMDTDEIVRRFRHERQILARLEHPGVARLLDGGVTGDGLPYFVMECVEGEPLDAYCDRLRLPVRERLELFMDVLEAVRYAHRNLVVHRDLKPSNILVTEGGERGRAEVKLLDFGIAKVLASDDPAYSVLLTETHTRRLTPDYAAPEQVRGEAPTTATDVYALGVLLYELLAGRRPYTFPTRTLAEIERTICERVPPRPSAAVLHPRTSAEEAALAPETIAAQRSTVPKRLRRALAGDLDAIVLKALRKEPERRYASAAELLDDLCRHADGRAVRARPDTFPYRASRFVRQHKAAAVTAALVLLTLVGGIVATTIQAQRAMRAYEEMGVQTERAESQRDFLASAFALADPDDPSALAVNQDDSTTAREVLRQMIGDARARIGELEHPLDQAAVLDVLGSAYTSRGYFAEAESTFAQALALKRGELRDGHAGLAESLVGLATAVQNYPDFDRATDLYEQAIGLLADAAPEERRLLPNVYNNLGWIHLSKGEFEDAEAWYTRSLREIADLESALGDDADLELLRAEGLNGLGVVLERLGKFEEAERALRQALSIQENKLGPSHPSVANTTFSLANCLLRKEDLHTAEDAYSRALAINRRVYGQEHVTIANVLQGLAALKHRLQESEEAEALYIQALGVYDQTVGPLHHWKAFCQIKLGRMLYETGDAERSVDYLQRGLSVLEQNGFAEDDPIVLQGNQWLVESLARPNA